MVFVKRLSSIFNFNSAKTVGRDIESLQSPCLRHNFNFPEDIFLEAKTWTILFTSNIFAKFYVNFSKIILGTFPTKSIFYMLMI